jgi:hypothetical protein
MASWKKVIVSGSSAELSGVSVGSNQAITTAAATTKLSGSFSGSFSGDGSGLTGVTANFPSTAVTDLLSTNQIFVNDGTGNKYITYANLVGDLAGTNLTTETDATGVDSLKLDTNLTGLTSVAASTFTGNLTGNVTGNVTGALTGTASWAEYVVNGSGGDLKISGSTGGVATGGTTVNLNDDTLKLYGTNNQIDTTVTTDTITIGFPQNVTIPNNLTVANNLTVNGTTTTVSTQNLLVGDRFVLLASSSNPQATDGGIIVASSKAGTPPTQSGYAFFLNGETTDTPRWGVSASVSQFTTTNVTPDEYAVTAKKASGAPSTAPTYGGSTLGYGNIYVNSADESIWIYS